MPKLVIVEGEGTREVDLKDGDTLGRVSQNAIQLKVKEASRTHCRFTQEKAAWFVEDLGSSNGTLVNGRRVTKFELRDGDVIQIGNVTLRFLESALVEEPASPSWGEDDISLEEQVFLVLGGAGRNGEVIKLSEGRLTIGRNARHALVLKDASVSGDHAEIRRDGERIFIKDLGSSNGTFVNGRRVEEVELVSGDEIRFGTIPATFGIGDPAEVALESGLAGEEDFSESGATAMMPMGGALDDASFELHQLPPRRETAWNIIALVVILALGGGVGFLMTRSRSEAATGDARAVKQSSNLLPELVWSFELSDSGEAEDEGVGQPVWRPLDLDDLSNMSEVSDPVRSGSFAYEFVRSGDRPTPSLLMLSFPVIVSSGSCWRLSAYTRGDGCLPVLGIQWLEGRIDAQTEAVDVTRDLIFGPPTPDTWSEVSGVFITPEGCTLAKVIVGAAGSGHLVVDDVSLSSTDVPEGRIVEVASFKAALDHHGTFRLSRFGRRLIDGLGIIIREGDRVLTQEELLVVDREWVPPTEVAGPLREGRGGLAVSLEGESGLKLRIRGAGLSAATAIAVPLVSREGVDLQVTLIDEERAQRFDQAFADQSATALIVGTGVDRAKIYLKDGSGSPQRLSSTLELHRGGGTLFVSHEGRDELLLEFQLTFEDEQQEARQLLSEAQQAARTQRSGVALIAAENVIARFPFESKAMEDANKLHAQLMSKGREELETLKRRVEDAVFFGDFQRETVLASQIEAARERYGGTSLGNEFESLGRELARKRTSFEQPRREAEARQLLTRGHEYASDEKRALALLFYDAVAENYDGTDEADQARELAQRLRGTGSSKTEER